MTLQQMEYIVAIDRYRNFARAAEACNVTQPTLSAMLSKLEEEMGVKVFNRTNKSVSPTQIGERIIQQSVRVLADAARMSEILQDATDSVSGRFHLGVGQTMASYLIPPLVEHYYREYPEVDLKVGEMRWSEICSELLAGNTDAAIFDSGLSAPGLLEVPLYTERFAIYAAHDSWEDLNDVHATEANHRKLWLMSGLMGQAETSNATPAPFGITTFDSGSIDTLIRITDHMGGFTVIPEMYVPLLSPEQQLTVRHFSGESHQGFSTARHVSLYLRQDYVRQGMINAFVSVLKHIVPPELLDDRIKRFGIRL